MAANVTEGSTTLSFAYDDAHQRTTLTSSSATTTYLNGPGNEEKFVSGSTTTWRDYVVADGAIVAERSNVMGVIGTQYFVTDNLGSTSVLTASTGAVSERDSYDSFGKRRNANGSDNTTCSITSATTRGYTGQEMMDPVCLINLNARIYDPMLGRIMSADDIVPDAYDGQSYNRYSYVDNGPLSAIDPTGHASCTPHPCQPVETITVTGYSGCACGGGGGGADGQPGRDAPTVNEVVLVTAPRYKSEPLFIATLSPLNLIGLIISPAEAAEKINNKNDPNKTCQQHGFGFGIVGGGSAEAGIPGVAGAGATGSAGAGAFYNSGTGGSAATYVGGGSFTQTSRTASTSAPTSAQSGAFGAFAGGGVGFFATNAGSGQQLLGPFDTTTANIGVGEFQFTLQIANDSNGTFIGSITIGPGLGVSGSQYPTNTKSVHSTTGC